MKSDRRTIAEGLDLWPTPALEQVFTHYQQECDCKPVIAAVCLLQLAFVLSAAEPTLVKLAVTEGKDIRFAHLTSRDGLPPGQIREILQDDQGFLWFNSQVMLNRYDGYRFKSYRREPAHPNHPAGGFLQSFFRDRSGAPPWVW